MEKALRMNLLFDFYGPLLTQRQQEVFQMYYHEDCSLGEIGDELFISRQAVHDLLRRAGLTLENFETNLQLVCKFEEQLQSLERLLHRLDQVYTAVSKRGLGAEASCLADIRNDLHQLLSN